MPHGVPDWNRTGGTNQLYQLTDLAEHAARSGSINTFDRRGDTIWQDDFEGSVLQWDTTTGGTGAAVALDTVRARSGIQSVLLTGGSDGGRDAIISRQFPFPSSGNIGLEFSFQMDADVEHLELRLFATSLSGNPRFRVRFIPASDTWQHFNAIGVYTIFSGGFKLLAAPTLFHSVKLVVDPINFEYVRLIVDQNILTMASLTPVVEAAGSDTNVDVLLRVQSSNGNNETMRIDDVIYTQNEP